MLSHVKMWLKNSTVISIAFDLQLHLVHWNHFDPHLDKFPGLIEYNKFSITIEQMICSSWSISLKSDEIRNFSFLLQSGRVVDLMS